MDLCATGWSSGASTSKAWVWLCKMQSWEHCLTCKSRDLESLLRSRLCPEPPSSSLREHSSPSTSEKVRAVLQSGSSTFQGRGRMGGMNNYMICSKQHVISPCPHILPTPSPGMGCSHTYLCSNLTIPLAQQNWTMSGDLARKVKFAPLSTAAESKSNNQSNSLTRSSSASYKLLLPLKHGRQERKITAAGFHCCHMGLICVWNETFHFLCCGSTSSKGGVSSSSSGSTRKDFSFTTFPKLSANHTTPHSPSSGSKEWSKSSYALWRWQVGWNIWEQFGAIRLWFLCMGALAISFESCWLDW